jgi:hypothetical protein
VTHRYQIPHPPAHLYEQSSSAAESLREQAARLSTLVDTFRLADDSRAADTPSLRRAPALSNP